ncbi:hypothetical protein P9220_08870 [Caballeronia sp. LZ016]|nr:hypothetical protein [Caballeronia sp. LZ016]MDR5738004.1 hypothetical protein [Caballeronia sp. LZ016]
MDSQKINLRNVTLCAVDCINPVLASRALDISKRGCLFGDSVLLTDKRVESNSRIALIPAIGSREEYSAFILKHLLRHVSTPWVLLIQWDGFVVNPSAWTEDFFSCDYIGALAVSSRRDVRRQWRLFAAFPAASGDTRNRRTVSAASANRRRRTDLPHISPTAGTRIRHSLRRRTAGRSFLA